MYSEARVKLTFLYTVYTSKMQSYFEDFTNPESRFEKNLTSF